MIGLWWCLKCDGATQNYRLCPKCHTLAVYQTFALWPIVAHEQEQAKTWPYGLRSDFWQVIDADLAKLEAK